MLVNSVQGGNRQASHHNRPGHDKKSFMNNDTEADAYPDEQRDARRINFRFRFSQRFHSSFLVEEQ